MRRASRQAKAITIPRTLLIAAGVAAAVSGVAACAGVEPAPSEQTGDEDEAGEGTDASDGLVGPEFTLVESLPGAPAPDERTWVRFGPEELTGSGGCNDLHGIWAVEGDRLRVESLGTTDMACHGPAGEADSALADLLTAEPAVTLADDRLTLESGEATAVFERTDPLAEELAGSWSVVGVTEPDEPDESEPEPPGEEATLELTEGWFALDATCAVFEGELVVDGDELHYRMRIAGPRPCDSGDRSVEALSRFFSGTARWDVDGDTLAITDPGGDTLILARP